MYAVNATDLSIALIDRLFLISLHRRSVFRLPTHWPHWPHSAELRVWSKNFRSLCSRTYSHPQFKNVTTAVECSTLGTSLIAILRWKQEVGKVFIKTDVLGRPHITQTCVGSGLLFPVPFCLPSRCLQNKKAGAAHVTKMCRTFMINL